MMDFAERLFSHYRLAILLSLIEEPAEERLRYAVLRVLSRIPGRSANASQLQDLLPHYGINVSRDEVVAVLAWADRARLVMGTSDNGVLGALLLDLGREAAAGDAIVPGAAPAPSPEWLQRNLEAKSIRLGMKDLLGHLGWCEDQGLVVFDDKTPGHSGLMFITPLGRDVALGRSEIDGVKAPSASTIMRLASNAATTRLGR